MDATKVLSAARHIVNQFQVDAKNGVTVYDPSMSASAIAAHAANCVLEAVSDVIEQERKVAP